MKNWTTCNLEDYIKLIDYRGRTPVKTESGVRLITAKNVKLGYLQLEPQEFIAEDNYESWMTRGIPNFGDVIFTTEAPLANVAQIDTHEKLAFAQRIIVMQPDSQKLNQTFLKYLLISDSVREMILDNGTGATVTGIKSKLLKKIRISFPSLPEQQRIVSILDHCFEAIDKAKANAEQNLQNAKELFESYLQGVFESGNWKTERFEVLCDLITCGVASTPKYVDEEIGVPFLSAQNVRNGEVVLDKYRFISKEFHEHLTKKNMPQKGDILYSRVGAKYGEAAVVEHDFEFSVYVSLTLIKPKKGKLNNYFLKYLLNSPSIKDMAKKSISSSGVPNLNVKSVRGFEIVCPPLSIQENLVKEIEKLQIATQQLQSHYQKRIDDLEELKKSILQKAFAGELKTEKVVEELEEIQL